MSSANRPVNMMQAYCIKYGLAEFLLVQYIRYATLILDETCIGRNTHCTEHPSKDTNRGLLRRAGGATRHPRRLSAARGSERRRGRRFSVSVSLGRTARRSRPVLHTGCVSLRAATDTCTYRIALAPTRTRRTPHWFSWQAGPRRRGTAGRRVSLSRRHGQGMCATVT